MLAETDLTHAVAIAAATDNDTTNLSLIVAARRINPNLFVIARQNQPVNAPLFDALHINSILVPTRLIAHEITARLGDPMLWSFVQAARQQTDQWSRALLDRLEASCGDRRPDLWEPVLQGTDNRALDSWLASGSARLGDLLRDPDDRDERLDCVVLLLQKGDESIAAPDDDTILRPGDRLLVAGTTQARRGLDNTLWVPETLVYVTSGRRVGNGWVWRTLVNRD